MNEEIELDEEIDEMESEMDDVDIDLATFAAQEEEGDDSVDDKNGTVAEEGDTDDLGEEGWVDDLVGELSEQDLEEELEEVDEEIAGELSCCFQFMVMLDEHI